MTRSAEPNKAAALCAVGAVFLSTGSNGVRSGWTTAGMLTAGVIALLFASVAFRRERNHAPASPTVDPLDAAATEAWRRAYGPVDPGFSA